MISNTKTVEVNKTKIIALLALSGFILLAVLMFMSGGTQSQGYEKDELLAVENAAVEVMPITMQSSYLRERLVYGQVESAMQSDVGFELAGVLESFMVEEGMSVSQGQALAQLDMARLEAQENELKAALARAEADARLAGLSTQRVSDLVKAKLEPQQRLDESQASLDAAQALVSEVEARLETLEVEKQKSTLRAPFDGQVFAQLADEGTVLSVGQPLLSLISISSLEARFGLPENIAFALKEGDEYQLQLPNAQINAQVKSVAKRRTFATRTVDTLFTIDQNSLSADQIFALVSGDLVSISVNAEVERRGVWLPIDALANGVRGLWTVLVYDETDASLHSRVVSVEHIDSDRAFVSGALEEGQKIVIGGTHRFTPGQQVKNVRVVEASQNQRSATAESRQ